MNIKKLNTFFIYSVSCLTLIHLMNSYYGLIIMAEPIGPYYLYGLWLQDLILGLIIIILLNLDKLSFISYSYLIFSISDAFFIEPSFNAYKPMYWLHRGDIQFFIGLNLWMLELIFSILGLSVWLWLRFGRHKSQLKYS